MTLPPAVGRLASIAYADMAPLVKQSRDDERGYPLLQFLHAYYMPLQTIDDLVRDRPESNLPGWGILVDPDLCPLRYLPWLAMMAGVRIRPEMGEAEIRSRIKLRDGRHRCTPAALVQAAQDNLLSGTEKRVILRERYDPANPTIDSPGHFQVITYTDETPDSAAVLAAMLEHKDVGLIMHYSVLSGQDWQQVINDYASWSTVIADYATWQNVIDDTP